MEKQAIIVLVSDIWALFFRKVNLCRLIPLLLKWPKHGGEHLRPEEAPGWKGPEVSSEDQILDEAI